MGLIYTIILTISYILHILLIILKYSGDFQPCQTKLNGFATHITQLRDITLSDITQFDQLKASRVITQ